MLSEQPALLEIEAEASPKRTAFPPDDIVKTSIILDADGSGLTPPISSALVELLPLASLAICVEESPKLIEFPNVAIVIKSIELLFVGVPPPKNPLVGD